MKKYLSGWRIPFYFILTVSVLLGAALGSVAAYAHFQDVTLSYGNNTPVITHSHTVDGYWQYYYQCKPNIDDYGYYVYVYTVRQYNGDSNSHDTIKYGVAYMWAQPGTTKTIYEFFGAKIYGTDWTATISQSWNTSSTYPLQYQQNIVNGTDPLGVDGFVAHP